MINPLAELKEYEDLTEALKKGRGPVHVTGTMDSQKVQLMHELGGNKGWKLVVTYDSQRAREIYEDFRNFTNQVWLYSAKTCCFSVRIFMEILWCGNVWQCCVI